MFEVFLASLGGYDFASLLNQLDQMGFFKYILPFLLIFAVVYAILTKIDLFKDNKGASILVAFAIGLLALQLDFVSEFFQTVFPKFGIGLSILLIALILGGSFIPPDKDGKKAIFGWIMTSIGGIIFLIIVILSFSSWPYANIWWDQYGALVVVAIVVIIAMVMVMVMTKKD